MPPRPFAMRGEEARPGRGQDRATVVEVPRHTLVVVADGAGGVAGGAAAAAPRFCPFQVAGPKSSPDTTDWGRIAAPAGDDDQAHLIADFRALVGVTPGAFAKHASELR